MARSSSTWTSPLSAETKAKITGRPRTHRSGGPNGGPTPTYGTWISMRKRMRNPNHKDFAAYGARLDMDPRWDSFENFLADMGERPEGKTIDRINNARGYWPDNCRWSTASEQQHNRRDNRS